MSIRIHHLYCGTMCPLCERLMNDRQGSWSKPGRLVCHVLLIETPGGLVLFDTGMGTADCKEPARRLGGTYPRLFKPSLSLDETAISQIRRLGFDPEDVRHILLTHVDLDHAGGLADFPNARVHITKPELEQITQPTRRDLMRYRMVQFDHHPKWVVHEAPDEDWFGFEAMRPIPDLGVDIRIVPLVGHTRGHVGLAVESDNKWLLHCGDAYYHRSEVKGTPVAPIGLRFFETAIQAIPKMRVENQHRLRELVTNHGDEVELFCAHDPVELGAYTSSATPSVAEV